MDQSTSTENSVDNVLENKIQNSHSHFANNYAQSNFFASNMTLPNDFFSNECVDAGVPACQPTCNKTAQNMPNATGSNPFLNFLRDFRKNHRDLPIIKAVQIGAAEWRNLETCTKLAYFKEAFVANGGNLSEQECGGIDGSVGQIINKCTGAQNEIESLSVTCVAAKPKRRKKRKRDNKRKPAEKRKAYDRPGDRGRRACKYR